MSKATNKDKEFAETVKRLLEEIEELRAQKYEYKAEARKALKDAEQHRELNGFDYTFIAVLVGSTGAILLRTFGII